MRGTSRKGAAFWAGWAAVISVWAGAGAQAPEAGAFRSEWPKGVERVWPGPDYWTNRLQDWRIRDGRLECLAAAGDRNVHLLTRTLSGKPGTWSIRVRVRVLASPKDVRQKNWVGFRFGARGEFGDYRDSAVYGKGPEAGLLSDGTLFLGSLESLTSDVVRVSLEKSFYQGLDLALTAAPSGPASKLVLSAFRPGTDEKIADLASDNWPAENSAGNIALVAHLPDLETVEGSPAVAFEDWAVSGEAVERHDERAFGPVLFAQHTLSRGTLKMTAQMPPLGDQDGKTVRLQIRRENAWVEAAEAPLDPDSRTAVFRVAGWDGTKETPYRIVAAVAGSGGKLEEHEFAGTVRKEPWDKKDIVLAAFTGNNDLGFPHADLVPHVAAQNPDLLFFSGDQIYEPVGGYGVQTAPVEAAILDYLRKWYLFGWAFGGLLRDRPSVSIPDDHDVYHDNLWGAGGKATPAGLTGAAAQDQGGYKMPPRWVNMVQRTQTGHIPDPPDPVPVEQGVGVYFTGLDYAGLSLAVLEDRKWKSAPKTLLPTADVVNGWARNKEFNPLKEADVPGAVLLGPRQLKFLKTWAADWERGVWMKAVLSQTLFANVATLPADSLTDAVVPRLPILKPGEYPENDVPVADMDSNGWPPSGRNAALREVRKAFAVHIAGDQHLGSTIQYGVEAWKDAGWALCVPSISNYWPRRWFPKTPGANRRATDPPYAGDFRDGFGNRISVRAVVNPYQTGLKPEALHDRAAGYGIARFNRDTRRISLECWPRSAGPDAVGTKPYPGWPVVVSQAENYGKKPFGFLPTLRFRDLADPVIQVVEEKNGETVYTLRVKGNAFQPMVFAAGRYRVNAGEPGTDKWRSFGRLVPTAKSNSQVINVAFAPPPKKK
jgi:hypothetical protein